MNMLDENKAFFANLSSSMELRLMDLSRDLSSLYETKWLSDVILNMGGIKIECHRAILYARSPVLAVFLDKAHLDGQNTIYLPDMEWSVLDTILKYIYSGDLSQLTFANLPLVRLYEIAAFLEINSLQNFLTSQMTSKQTFPRDIVLNFSAQIYSFCSRERLENDWEHISEPFRYGLDEWYLHIRVFQIAISQYLVGVTLGRKSERRVTHMVVINISLFDAKGNECFPFMGEFIYKRDREHGTLLFVDRETLLENRGLYLPNDTLTLLCKLEISYDAYDANPDRHEMFKICNPESHRLYYYEGFTSLSNNLLRLYDRKPFIDLSFESSNRTFQVHTCILLRRASVSSSLIQLLCDNLYPEVAETFMIFMYSGKRHYFHEHAYLIYDVVSTLGLTSLKSKYSEYLSRVLSASNVIYMLVQSFRYKDKELKYNALHFIRENSSILLTEKWYRLMSDQHEIVLQTFQYLFEKSQLSRPRSPL